MSKKQKQAPRPGEFRHSPFKALKGIPINSRPSAAAPAATPAGDASREDAEVQFRRAVSGARPLHRSDEEPVRQEERQATTEQQNAGEQDVQLFLDAMRAPGAATFREQSFDDDEDGAGRRSPSSRMRQLKKGSIRIGQELDLHGFLKDEALRRLEQFIAAAVVRGLEAVLVITGKGTNSPGGPVLQGAVAQWLRGAGARYAAEFHPAPRDRGGSGAFVVFLKNRKT